MSGGAAWRRASSSGERARAISGAFAPTCRRTSPGRSRSSATTNRSRPSCRERRCTRKRSSDCWRRIVPSADGRGWSMVRRAQRSRRRAVGLDVANADLLRGGLEEWIEDVPHLQPFRGLIEEGRAGSACASVRDDGAGHAAGVETLRPSAAGGTRGRGRGLFRAVAGWVLCRSTAPRGRTASERHSAPRRVAVRRGLPCHVTRAR